MSGAAEGSKPTSHKEPGRPLPWAHTPWGNVGVRWRGRGSGGGVLTLPGLPRLHTPPHTHTHTLSLSQTLASLRKDGIYCWVLSNLSEVQVRLALSSAALQLWQQPPAKVMMSEEDADLEDFSSTFRIGKQGGVTLKGLGPMIKNLVQELGTLSTRH